LIFASGSIGDYGHQAGTLIGIEFESGFLYYILVVLAVELVELETISFVTSQM
jgi:hypothetical protein